MKVNNSVPRYGAVLPNQKTLRRLPHVFSKVLELPIRSDADVAVSETFDSLRFVAVGFSDGVRARTVEIHTGVTRTVISGDRFAAAGELDLDVWRFRLPAATRPELATAVCRGGDLVVTIPKLVKMDGAVF